MIRLSFARARWRALSPFLLFGLLPTCYPAYSAASPDDLEGYERLGQSLEEYRLAEGIPGISVAVGHSGKVAWSQGLGFADEEEHRPVTPQTSFQIASVTKGFAATVIMQLVEAGKLTLDDSASTYGVNVENDPSITIRELMSMTSDSAGEAFEYDGPRYDRLTEITEHASGEPFANLLMDGIVRPLKLEDTGPNIAAPVAFRESGLDSARFAENVAEPYMIREGELEREDEPPNWGTAVGVMASAEDLVKFGMALDDNTLLSDSLRTQMFTPGKNKKGGDLPYALGWFSQRYYGERVMWNFGEWDFASALLIKMPDRGVTFAVVANTDRLSKGYKLETGDLLRSPIARTFFEDVMGLGQ